MEILLGLAILGLTVSPLIIMRYAIKQNADLHDRLAAKSMDEYKYYRDQYPKEVAAWDKKRGEDEDEKGMGVPELLPEERLRRKAAENM